jgi:hypothetical protein
VCGIPKVTCNLGQLGAGTYTILVAGEGSRSGLPPRTLVVSSDGTESSCDLPQGNPPSLSGYATTGCSIDADCQPAVLGNPCQVCACPTAAITKASFAKYESDRRAATSQCQADNSGPVCAACAPVTGKCDVGTCKLVQANL